MNPGLTKPSRWALVVFWCALLLNSPMASSQGDAGGTVSPSADLTGDGIREVIETAPAFNADAGAVYVFDGATGNLIVRFVGPAGSRFGWSCATVPDINGDGLAELLIGAPGAQRAYLAMGPFVDVEDTEVDASRLNLILEPPPGMLTTEFGQDVGGLHDLDGDTLPDLRVAAMEMSASGQQQALTLVFQGLTGALVGIGHRAAPSAALEAAPGDADKDATVGGTDMTRVIETLGTATDGGAVEGDVTLDGAVDGADIAMVVEEWGTQLYLEVVPDLGACGDETYRIEAWGESICVEVVASSTEGGMLVVGEDPAETLYTAGNSCGAKLAGCLQEQIVIDALARVRQACGGSGAGGFVIARIFCVPCDSDRRDGWTFAYCHQTAQLPVLIAICDGLPPEAFCTTLAHELVHVAQACGAGVFGPACARFRRVWFDRLARICGELEAYQLSGECEAASDCCNRACISTQPDWRLNGAGCLACCEALVSHGCCTSGAVTPACAVTPPTPCP